MSDSGSTCARLCPPDFWPRRSGKARGQLTVGICIILNTHRRPLQWFRDNTLDTVSSSSSLVLWQSRRKRYSVELAYVRSYRQLLEQFTGCVLLPDVLFPAALRQLCGSDTSDTRNITPRVSLAGFQPVGKAMFSCSQLTHSLPDSKQCRKAIQQGQTNERNTVSPPAPSRR
jgi:hypothetical protein